MRNPLPNSTLQTLCDIPCEAGIPLGAKALPNTNWKEGSIHPQFSSAYPIQGREVHKSPVKNSQPYKSEL